MSSKWGPCGDAARWAGEESVEFWKYVAESLENIEYVQMLKQALGWPADATLNLSKWTLKSANSPAIDGDTAEFLDYLTRVLDHDLRAERLNEVLVGFPERDASEAAHRLFAFLSMSYVRQRWPALHWVTQPFAFANEAIETYGHGDTYGDRLENFLSVPFEYLSKGATAAFFLLEWLFSEDTFAPGKGFRYAIPAVAVGVWKKSFCLSGLTAAGIALIDAFKYHDHIVALLETESGVRQLSHLTFVPLVGVIAALEMKNPRREGDALYGWDPKDLENTDLAERVAERTLSFDGGSFADAAWAKAPRMTLAWVPQEHGGERGPGFMISLGGVGQWDTTLGDSWKLKASVKANSLVTLFIFRGGLFSPRYDGRLGGCELEVSLERAADELAASPSAGKKAKKPMAVEFLWGRTQLEGKLRIDSDIAEGVPECSLEITSKGSQLVLDPGGFPEFLGFLGELLPPKPSTIDFDLGVAYRHSKSGGSRLSLSQGSGFEVNLPYDKKLGPVRLQSLVVGLRAAESEKDPGFDLAFGADLGLELGPFTATVRQIGFGAGFSLPSSTVEKTSAASLLHSADLSPGFRPPSGIGLALSTPAISGGGFLDLDPERHEYSGVLQLEIPLKKGKLSLSAVGLLSTRVGGSGGYSLFVAITADMPGIPLGWNFKLSGVGGTIGVHRRVDVDVLRAGLSNRSLDAIFFPPNPMANLPRLVSALRKTFPVERKSHVVGLTFDFAWGSPEVITFRLGVLYTWGKSHRLIVAGQIRALLGKTGSKGKERALMDLGMDAIGVLDFGKDEVSIDATLVAGSRILSVALAGDMALRASWGPDPNFMLSIGGFHPDFAPPAGLRKLKRLSVDFTGRANPRVLLELYLAFTSNTWQFGAHLDLYVAVSSLSLEGHAALDVLIDKETCKYIANIGCAVAVKWRGRTLLGVSLEGVLGGTAPSFIRGKGRVKIWIFSASFDFDHTISENVAERLGTTEEPLEQLVLSLRDSRNWSAQLPEASRSPVTFNKSDTGGRVRVHPLGRLSVRQVVLPLDVELERFAGQRLPQARAFNIESPSLSGEPLTESESVPEHFAPGDFFEMNDSERISSPSFQKFDAGRAFGSSKVSWGNQTTKASPQYEVYPKSDKAPWAPPPRANSKADLGLAMTFGAVNRAPKRRASVYSLALGEGRGLSVRDTEYSVTLDGKIFDGGKTKSSHPTHAQALQSAKRFMTADPSLRGRLQVVSDIRRREVLK